MPVARGAGRDSRFFLTRVFDSQKHLFCRYLFSDLGIDRHASQAEAQRLNFLRQRGRHARACQAVALPPTSVSAVVCDGRSAPGLRTWSGHVR